jgi:GH24 family phage-related lysozyme (muramidase)
VQTIDPRLLADVKLAEGCKLVAYKDGKGYWTTGYGHLLDQSIDWTGHEISQQTADALLAQDIADRGWGPASRLPEWASLDTPARQNAVAESVFNLGVGHWTSEFPKTRASIEAKQWIPAATNLLNSPQWIRDVGIARVRRIAGYLQSGSYSLPLASALPL